MTFDWNLAKDTSMDNHPVYYVQYAHARAYLSGATKKP
jgi:arginyl-tRNA synthetase